MKVGARSIVGSGTVVTQTGDQIIQLAQSNLQFWLKFKNEPEGDGTTPLLTFEVLEDRLEIELKNFNNSLGSSWWGHVGNVNAKPLFLSFSVHAIGEGKDVTRVVNYTFSMETT